MTTKQQQQQQQRVSRFLEASLLRQAEGKLKNIQKCCLYLFTNHKNTPAKFAIKVRQFLPEKKLP